MANKLAIVICAHHKPWLMMSTLITAALQDYDDADLFVVLNKGDGERNFAGYEEYRGYVETGEINTQLSPYDDRVRHVSVLNGHRVHYLEYENDHSLDSGVWYKFIRSGAWRDYEYTLFIGEGVLLARPTVLSSLLAFAKRKGIDFVSSGHEKRRVPRDVFLNYNSRSDDPRPMDRFHDQMIREAMAVFCRDPAFKAVFENWRSNFDPETQNHVPDLLARSEFAWKCRGRIQQLWGSAYAEESSETTTPFRQIRHIPGMIDAFRSQLWMQLYTCCGDVREPAIPRIFVHGRRQSVSSVTTTECELGVRYHQVSAPEWFGCTVPIFMSRRLLACLSDRLDSYNIYDVLDLPFVGTPLELVWGFMPSWLGCEKWFTDGIHRVRKHFTTYQREDYPPEMASYINRYYCGRICVGWDGDYMKIRSLRRDYRDLVTILPERYF